MSRINDLIKELCPNGVEYINIEELFNIKNGYTPSKSIDEFWSNGDIPWFRMEDIRENGRILNDSIQHVSRSAVKGELFPENTIMIATTATIGEHALITVPSIGNQQLTFLWLKDKYKDKINMKYIYHYCFILDEYCKKNIKTGGFPAVLMSEFKKFNFAIPPKEVQEEIVRILDKFGELEAGLEAELEARKSQYEFWRDKVFEPKDTWTSKTMEELCTIITKQTGFDYSATIKPSLLDSKSDETYSFIQNKDFDGIRFNFDTDYYIPKNVADKYPKITLDCPSILFSISGKIGNVGLYESEKKAFIGGAIAICKLKPNLNNKYILYYLQSKYGQQYLFGNIKAASHLNVTVEAIRKINIKFPPLDEQKKIVNILDKFDILINDISEGLPAEIELRRQQYEYYRNKLLSFEELSVSE